ncbi:hypothetical protein BpHYR1_008630 [Brachionus plicatilis]|uniref:Uncharacterized protein n=1 Tax=Brachionus plicatilis TaxID=10195 RepID=A0A3M7RYI5_BRAPC|nr:hypothetical protein BpHYR1_008630 [Brachionus plicatilis]
MNDFKMTQNFIIEFTTNASKPSYSLGSLFELKLFSIMIPESEETKFSTASTILFDVDSSQKKGNEDINGWLVAPSTLSNLAEQIERTLGLLGASRLIEHIPEPERFVASTSHNGLAVRRHGQIQHSIRVTSQLGQLTHARILPDQYLILRVAMSADQLVGVFRPGQIAHLGARVHRLQILTGQRVPEPDTAVGSAAARGQQAVLMGRPGNGLHRRYVIIVGLYGRIAAVYIPHQQLQHVIGRPLQPAHFLLVAAKFALCFVGGRADIAQEHVAIAAARAEQVVIPGESADAGRHRADRVVAIGQVAQLSHLAGASGPQVDGGAEADAEHVCGRPVDQIQIEVVLELGRVQHFERHFGYFAYGLARRSEQLLGVGRERRERVGRMMMIQRRVHAHVLVDYFERRFVLEHGADVTRLQDGDGTRRRLKAAAGWLRVVLLIDMAYVLRVGGRIGRVEGVGGQSRVVMSEAVDGRAEQFVAQNGPVHGYVLVGVGARVSRIALVGDVGV